MKSSWYSLACSLKQINLDIALACGQSFRWVKNKDGEWMGVIKNVAYVLKQNNEAILFHIIGNNSCSSKDRPKDGTVEDRKPRIKKEDSGPVTPLDLQDGQLSITPPEIAPGRFIITKKDLEQSVENNCDINSTTHLCTTDDERLIHENNIKSYLQLDIDLETLYEDWKNADTNFKEICNSFQGIRMLRQDPVENLFSFICSQNNNIPRITSLVGKLCITFGTKITELNGHTFFTFPTLESLARDDVEEKLRKLGFGYRAKFINQSAQYILKHHSKDWLYNLRQLSYAEAHSALCKLPGVGAKVADCVCLMSLDKTEAVPVDTHVWQIACKAYLPHLRKYKSITDKVYQEVGDHFRSIFGKYAGWAHSVLFSADLKKFKDLHQSMSAEVPPPKETKVPTKGRKRAAAERKRGSKKKK